MKALRGCLTLIGAAVVIVLAAIVLLAYMFSGIDDPKPRAANKDSSSQAQPQGDTPTDLELFADKSDGQKTTARDEDKGKVVAKEFAIDEFESEGFYDDIALRIAQARLENSKLPSVERRIGSVGTLNRSYEVISIAASDALQVDFSSRDSIDLEIGFITNIQTRNVITGNRYSYDGPVMYAGVTQYTTVLGAKMSGHTYEVFPKSVSDKADELYAQMLEKQRTLAAREKEAERKRVERVGQRMELMKVIARMKQNARTLYSYDLSVRESVAERLGVELAEFESEGGEYWTEEKGGEFTAIVAGLRESNEAYISDSPDLDTLVKALDDLLNRARDLQP